MILNAVVSVSIPRALLTKETRDTGFTYMACMGNIWDRLFSFAILQQGAALQGQIYLVCVLHVEDVVIDLWPAFLVFFFSYFPFYQRR